MLNKDKSNQNEKTRNRTRYLLKEKSMKNILKVRMLGGFTLEYKGKELVLDRNNVSKTTQLFQLFSTYTGWRNLQSSTHRCPVWPKRCRK